MFCISIGNAQNATYYFHKEEKVHLNISKKHLTIFFKDTFNYTSVNQLGFKPFEVNTNSSDSICNKWARIEFINEPSNISYLQAINSLRAIPQIFNIQPCIESLNGEILNSYNYLYVKLKNSVNTNQFNDFLLNNKLTIFREVENMPKWYVLRCDKKSLNNSFEASIIAHNSNLFDAVQPAFDNFKIQILNNITEPTNQINNLVCSNDPKFNDLWNISNTGQLGGVAGVDMKVCEAWNFSTGNGIKIAVLDSGIKKTNIDLVNNILPYSYSTSTQSQPSNYYWFHGTIVAGIIAAEKDNNILGTGVSPDSKLIDISWANLQNPLADLHLSYGINWAWQNGADVINNSWGGPYPSSFINDAINNALNFGRNGKGAIMIFSAGNGNSDLPYYPTYDNTDVIAVGAINRNGNRSSYSNYGNRIDVIAPADGLKSTANEDSWTSMGGTSSACPNVTGVASLILEVNPCLSYLDVKNIIEMTCQKIGNYSYSNYTNRINGTWNYEMGYGLPNANLAVQMALNIYNTNDFYVKDNPLDIGEEPNLSTVYFWDSPSIWVRNQLDFVEEHQSPEFSINQLSYVYVRVNNNNNSNCSGVLNQPSRVDLFYSKPTNILNNQTESSKNGILPNTGTELILIGSQEILDTSSVSDLVFEWQVPDPKLFSTCTGNSFDTFLLAKIVSANDTLSFPETDNIYFDIQNNNNIAAKSVAVVDFQSLIFNSPNTNNYETIGIKLTNPYNYSKNFDIFLECDKNEYGKSIVQESEVSVLMDDKLLGIWNLSEYSMNNNLNTLNENVKTISEKEIKFKNLILQPYDSLNLEISFNFLMKEISDKKLYKYHLIQKIANTDTIINAITLNIKKTNREPFFANAGYDQYTNENEPIILSASIINEPVIYNWYDSLGNLIFQGKDFVVPTEITDKFKLEVIALNDGFKDYDEVEIKERNSEIVSIFPNPFENSLNINYSNTSLSSAYITIIGSYGNNSTSNNYILNSNDTNINIDTSNFSSGFYTVALIVNVDIADIKNIYKP